ncbi:MAG: GWxTD domain-containing protein [Candidatus Aminicenantes bacterium]|nr:GWxTD domain-containing protein [Candidatus Aminicenantes bacterium]
MKDRLPAGIFYLVLFAAAVVVNTGARGPEPAQAKEPLSDASKQWLDEVVPYIITAREKEVFLSLPTEADRGRFIEMFWEKRDPNRQTPENEFKLEYYRRIALANKLFGAGGVPGWRTDRGRFYILLGPPKEIERDLTSSVSALTMTQGPKETWQYWDLPNPNLPYNLEITFVDKFGTGNYVLQQALNTDQGRNTPLDMSDMTFQFNYMETLAEAMKNPFENLEKLKGIITTQVTYSLIPFESTAFAFKGAEEKTLLPLVVSMPYSSLASKRSGYDYFFSLNLTVNVSNSLGQVVFEASKDLNFKKTATELARVLDGSFRFQTSFSLDPGDYRLHLLVLDNYSGKIGTSHRAFSVPDFSGEGPEMSDIVLSSHSLQEEVVPVDEARKLAEELGRADPRRIFESGAEMSVFFEAYNLSLDETSGWNHVRIEYVFLQAGQVLVRNPAPPVERTPQKDCRVRTSFRLKNFEPGEYSLRATVVDENSKRSVSREISFTILASRAPTGR